MVFKDEVVSHEKFSCTRVSRYLWYELLHNWKLNLQIIFLAWWSLINIPQCQKKSGACTSHAVPESPPRSSFCWWESGICSSCTCCFAVAQGHIVALTSSASDQLSTSAKNPRTHARFSVVECKQIHFLPHEKCAHAQELSRTILHVIISRSFLGDLWYQIWTGIKALLTGAFPLILMASEWGPIKGTGISSNSLWWITKAFPSGCHHSHAVLPESGDQPTEKKKGKRWKSTVW